MSDEQDRTALERQIGICLVVFLICAAMIERELSGQVRMSWILGYMTGWVVRNTQWRIKPRTEETASGETPKPDAQMKSWACSCGNLNPYLNPICSHCGKFRA